MNDCDTAEPNLPRVFASDPLDGCKSRATPSGWLAFLMLSVLWIVMVAVVNPIGDFPLNDDWVYGGAAQRLAHDGDLRIPASTIANVISQVAWGALFCLPFECSFTVLRFSTLVLGLLAVLALYALVREIGGDSRTALLASATLAVNPLYFDLANSFMTDVPFASFTTLSIYLAVRGFRRQSQLSLAFGVLTALMALLDRQLGIVLLFGFAVAYSIRSGFKPASILKGVILLGFGLALHFTYQRWLIATGRIQELEHSNAADFLPTSLISFVVNSIKLTANSLPYIGLFVLPLLIGLPGRPTSQAPGRQEKALRAFCGLVAAALSGALWHGGHLPALGNVMTASGFGPMSLRGNEPPHGFAVTTLWLLLTILGALGAYLMLVRIALFAKGRWSQRRRVGSEQWLVPFLVVTLLSYWFLVCLLAFADGFFYDRYLLFLVPVTLILMCALTNAEHPASLIASEKRWRQMHRIVAPALLLAFAGLSVAGTHDYLAWNRARWTAADFLTKQEGIPPEKIDGGYEFNSRNKEQSGKGRWAVDDEYVIAFGQIDKYHQVFEFPYTRWLLPSRPTVLILRRDAPSGG